jgi:hypothetical protein
MKNLIAVALLTLASFHSALAEEQPGGLLFEPVIESVTQMGREPVAPCIARGDCYLFEETNPSYFAVPANQPLRLLGKGVQGKKTKQNLSIACVGENLACDVLRFVYYVSPQELYFMGPKFTVSNNPKALKAAMKTLSKNSKGGSSQLIGGITLFAGLIGCIALLPVAGPTPFMILFGGAFVSYKALGSGATGEPFDMVNNIKMVTKGDDGVQLTNTNGWNWSSQPRRISEKQFGRMIRYFQYANGFFYDNNGKNISIVR